MKIKKLFVMTILICFSFVLSGCVAMGYSFISNEDGSFTENFIIELDEEYLTQNSVDLSSLKAEINTDFLEYKSRIVTLYQTNYQTILHETTTEEGINYESSWDENTFYGKINYPTTNELILIYGPDVFSSVEWTTELSNVFMNKYYFSRLTEFAYIQNEDSFYNTLYEKYTTEYAGVVDFDKVTYVYQYVTDDSRLHSDADSIIRLSREKYVHSWIIPASTAVDKEITFFYYEARPLFWYIGGIALALSIGIIYALTINIIDKLRHIKGLEKIK